MPYDAKLDECLFSKSWEGDVHRLTVSVFSYNKGQKKLQLTRENKSNDGQFRFTRLGRINQEETEAILPLMQEALAVMNT